MEGVSVRAGEGRPVDVAADHHSLSLVKMKDTPKAHLFISYSRKDREVVDRLAARLEKAGYQVWIDRKGILGGVEWRKAIPREIGRAEAFLLMISPNSVASRWVRKEFDYALKKRVRIIPIVIKPADLPRSMQMHLGKLQKIKSWRRRTVFSELLEALGGLRGVAAQAPGTLDQQALQENTRLISELLRIMQKVSFGASHVIFTGGKDGAYYIQMQGIRDEVEIYAEAVGNKNLQEPYLLTKDQIKKLFDLQWEKPDKMSAGNYRRIWEAYSDHDRTVIAGQVMRAFLEVYGHSWGENLEVEIRLD